MLPVRFRGVYARFPAHAGMYRRRGSCTVGLAALPRTRGDRPNRVGELEPYATDPPQARGWTRTRDERRGKTTGLRRARGNTAENLGRRPTFSEASPGARARG